jgi:CheY-like chemotaxis protein
MTRVLLVEDDSEQLALRRLIFERSGYEVAAAGSAREALEQLPGCEVVVMDLKLPEAKDGLDLIRAIGSRARIIVLSGAGEDDLPVDYFLLKPCSTQVLLDAVAKLCAK